MPTELTGSAVWRPTITAPATGDARTAASVSTMGQDLADSLAYLNAQDASNYAALDAVISGKVVRNYYSTNRGSYSSPTNELSNTFGDYERIMLASPWQSPWSWPDLVVGDVTIFHVGIQFDWECNDDLDWPASELRVYLSNGEVSPAHSLSHANSWTLDVSVYRSKAAFGSLTWINRVATPAAFPTFDLKCLNNTSPTASTLRILGYDVTALLIRGM